MFATAKQAEIDGGPPVDEDAVLAAILAVDPVSAREKSEETPLFGYRRKRTGKRHKRSGKKTPKGRGRRGRREVRRDVLDSNGEIVPPGSSTSEEGSGEDLGTAGAASSGQDAEAPVAAGSEPGGPALGAAEAVAHSCSSGPNRAPQLEARLDAQFEEDSSVGSAASGIWGGA